MKTAGAVLQACVIMGVALASFGQRVAKADPYIFGGTTAGGFYSIDTNTGQCSLLATGTQLNQLAFDSSNSSATRLVYSHNVAGDWGMYSRSVTYTAGVPTGLGAETVLSSDIRPLYGSTWPGGSATNTNIDMTGAGDYHNGTYYFIPDEVVTTGPQNSYANMLTMTFTAGGVINTVGEVVIGPNRNADMGDFGDIAISGDTLYGVSRLLGLFKVDLSNPSAGWTTLQAGRTVGQIAFDPLGRLWTNAATDGKASTGSFYQVDLTTGATLSTLTLTGSPGDVWTDLATNGPPTATPEPATLSMLVLGGLGLAGRIIRRKKR